MIENIKIIFIVLDIIKIFEISCNKLCFAELYIIYQRMIHLTYYVFITNNTMDDGNPSPILTRPGTI